MADAKMQMHSLMAICGHFSNLNLVHNYFSGVSIEMCHQLHSYNQILESVTLTISTLSMQHHATCGFSKQWMPSEDWIGYAV